MSHNKQILSGCTPKHWPNFFFVFMRIFVGVIASAHLAACSDCSVDTTTENRCQIEGEPRATELTGTLEITVENFGIFEVPLQGPETVRPDIFMPGHLSIFDLLVFLDQTNDGFSMAYHFDETLDTHIIDSINETPNWFYAMNYHSGMEFGDMSAIEEQYLRIDYAVVKDKMTVELRQYSDEELERRFSMWRTEVNRRQANGGKLIIPEVVIIGEDQVRTEFENVEVESHGLRSDIFADGVLTAADVVLSLGTQQRISCRAEWLDTYGTAELKGYFFRMFNETEARYCCGFSYHLGERARQHDFGTPGSGEVNPVDVFSGGELPTFGGNDTHILMGIRVLHNPEYFEILWLPMMDCPGEGDTVESNATNPVNSDHFGWFNADCRSCHSPDAHNNGLLPHECVPCHGTNGAPLGHFGMMCNMCHAENHAEEGFPQSSCLSCHPRLDGWE